MRAAPVLLRLVLVLAGMTSAGAVWAQQGLQLKSNAYSGSLSRAYGGQGFGGGASLDDGSPGGSGSTTSHWQARVQMNQALDDAGGSYDARNGSRILSANLLGDYYLTGSGLGQGTRGGLRATGGLLVGPLSLVQSSSGMALGRGASLSPYLSVGQRSLSLLTAAEREPSLSMSYVGLGYTSYSLRGGWGFSADLGMLAGGAPGLRLGNSAPLDDMSRDVRFKPVLQLGVSYSF
ncbi:hypothetical protein [Roseateles terrae]|uniref:Outer membrane protein beta-barrel domain-containing protein n=1 Tax=Roseateles terrae TaxID=431060 RepID=A0ABR6GUR9_9BURK|nr:hypothetical protein [Roseateles terrae]MBB3195805.1 hypothetical protein [Roseateles terrae]OWQ86689.1 hypothetical protein CDN98_13270 [Roseateles terrae]